MSPEQARDLRHELRTPVNHLIGYAELLLEEDGLSPANAAQLEAIRSVARQVLALVPGLLAEDGTLAASAATLAGHVSELERAAAALRAEASALPMADVDRIESAARRLRELGARLADGGVGMARTAGVAQAARSGGRETILVVDGYLHDGSPR